MAELGEERPKDVLDAITQHPDNQGNEKILEIVRELRTSLEAEKAVIPTLESITPAVSQTSTLAASEQGSGGSVRIHQITPDLFSKVFPQISLPEEHRRQGLIKASRFAARRKLSEDAYIALLPQFPERPAIYDKLGLKVPLLLENGIAWMEVAELSHGEGELGIYVSDYLRRMENAGEVEEWTEDGFDMSKYLMVAAWVQDGTKLKNRKPRDVRNELLTNGEYREHYKAGRIPFGNALWNVRPDMVRTMGWDIIGDSVGSGSCAYLSRWGDQTELGARGLGFADPRFRALVFGSKFEARPLAA